MKLATPSTQQHAPHPAPRELHKHAWQPRFLCDEMLGDLSRYLRAGGFDTVFACGGAPDSANLAQAVSEHRWLLTRDRDILKHRSACGAALLLPTEGLEEHAAFLTAKLRLNWLTLAFTRCLRDNTPLQQATSDEWNRIPLVARASIDRASSCPTCGRVYWEGSHFRRMHATLLRWQLQHGGTLQREPHAN
jgi:uncharacterized protein with PIN domain